MVIQFLLATDDCFKNFHSYFPLQLKEEVNLFLNKLQKTEVEVLLY